MNRRRIIFFLLLIILLPNVSVFSVEAEEMTTSSSSISEKTDQNTEDNLTPSENANTADDTSKEKETTDSKSVSEETKETTKDSKTKEETIESSEAKEDSEEVKKADLRLLAANEADPRTYIADYYYIQYRARLLSEPYFFRICIQTVTTPVRIPGKKLR